MPTPDATDFARPVYFKILIKPLPAEPAKNDPFIILLSLTPDNFTYQRETPGCQ